MTGQCPCTEQSGLAKFGFSEIYVTVQMGVCRLLASVIHLVHDSLYWQLAGSLLYPEQCWMLPSYGHILTVMQCVSNLHHSPS